MSNISRFVFSLSACLPRYNFCISVFCIGIDWKLPYLPSSTPRSPNCISIKKKDGIEDRAFTSLFQYFRILTNQSHRNIFHLLAYIYTIRRIDARKKEYRGRMVTRRKLFSPRNIVRYLECIVRNV